jgi:hypothetical protein
MHPHDWWVTPMDLEGIDSDMKRAVTTGRKEERRAKTFLERCLESRISRARVR